ncbi:hypothetical protein KR038_007675 [Drosophila bunnanda]|nr:hypothetical protein KR038_007675 [Drosophila bunnanda]
MGRNLCFLVTLILAFGYGFGQELPPVACPDNFAYLKLDDRYVGQVSVVLNGSSTENKVQVELAGRGVMAQKTVGEIKLSDSGVTVKEKLQKNEKQLANGLVRDGCAAQGAEDHCQRRNHLPR